MKQEKSGLAWWIGLLLAPLGCLIGPSVFIGTLVGVTLLLFGIPIALVMGPRLGLAPWAVPVCLLLGMYALARAAKKDGDKK